jgi:hypothetical protein
MWKKLLLLSTMVKEYKLTSKDMETKDKMDGLYQHIAEGYMEDTRYMFCS